MSDEQYHSAPPPPPRQPARPVRRPDPDDDFDDEGGGDDPLRTMIPYKNARALIAYYCGVFAIIPGLGLLLGPAALILGIMGIRYVGRNPTAKGTGHAITGIVLGILTSLFNCGGFLFFLIGFIVAAKQ